MPQEFAQFGVAGITLAILFFIVRYFVSTIREKDKEIIKLFADFKETIDNHLAHETKAFERLTEVIEKLQSRKK